MKISLTEFVTLDGVCQGPGSPDEDTSDGFTAGGWLVPHMDAAFVQRASDWLDLADGLLFGRRTYEAFARDWPAITDPADPFAGRMNTLPKYVVSHTLTEGSWHPTTVLTGDPAEAVAELRARPGRELQIHGSARLGDALLAAGLVRHAPPRRRAHGPAHRPAPAVRPGRPVGPAPGPPRGDAERPAAPGVRDDGPGATGYVRGCRRLHLGGAASRRRKAVTSPRVRNVPERPERP